MGRPEAIDLPDEAVLTQFGETSTDPPFRNVLRSDIGETELSLILGGVDALAASMLVTKTIAPFRVCRTTTVGILREQGFVVRHSPTRGNPLHVSVYSPILENGESAEWGIALAKRYDDCFTNTQGGV